MLVLFGLFLHFNKPIAEIDQSKLMASALIPYSSEYNFRQTINDCGPFNVAAMVRALTGEAVDSAEFAETIGWRLPNKYTLPWGMEKQLKENEVIVLIPNVKDLLDSEKLNYLRSELSQKHPIIVLGQQENYEHYITLLGFDKAADEFYVYDSLFEKKEEGFTKDENGELPGNRTLSSELLLKFWRGGGMYGVYEWYAIVGSLDEDSII